MTEKICDRIKIFILNNKVILIVAAIILTIIVLLYYSICICSIIDGLFLILAGVTTAYLAIKKYKTEQRTSRIQEVYFTDTLLKLAKLIDYNLSIANKNYLVIENFTELVPIILNRKNMDLETKRGELKRIFQQTEQDIEIKNKTSDFRKETLSKLFYESGDKINATPTWIKIIEDDSYRFSALLKSQITILEADIKKLTDDNLTAFEKHFLSLMRDNIKENYEFIKRHYIFLTLYSNIVLEFSTKDFGTIEEILSSFKDDKIKSSIDLINVAYINLVLNFRELAVSLRDFHWYSLLTYKTPCRDSYLNPT